LLSFGAESFVFQFLSKNIKINIYRTIRLPVVLCMCETWLLTLREGHRLRVFENRVLRSIFGPTWDKVTGVWRKLHIIQVTKLRMRWHERRGAYKVLVEKPEGTTWKTQA